MTEHRRTSRRAILASTVAATLLSCADTSALAAPRSSDGATADSWRGLKVGVASYSLRKLPRDAALKGIQRVGLAYVSIKDFHLPLDSTPEQRKAVARQFRDAGLTPISCGVITTDNDEAAIRRAFEYARDIGAPTIVGNPHPESMPVLDKLVKEFDIRMAVHNHGPGDQRWPTPYEPMKAAEKFDPRIGVCIDVGHTARAGVDPAESIRKCAARLYDVHLKDVDRAVAEGKEVEIGRGVLDTRGILQALLDVKFAGHLGFEHEKDPDDPLPGLAESVGYVKGVLAVLTPP